MIQLMMEKINLQEAEPDERVTDYYNIGKDGSDLRRWQQI